MNIYIPNKHRIVNYGSGCTIYIEGDSVIFEGTFGYPVKLGDFNNKETAKYIFEDIMQQYALNAKNYTIPEYLLI